MPVRTRFSAISSPRSWDFEGVARIAYPSAEDLPVEVADRLVRLGSLNVTRMLAHNVPLMEAYGRFGVMLLRKGR